MHSDKAVCTILLHLDDEVLGPLDNLIAAGNARQLATKVDGNTPEEIDKAMEWVKHQQKTTKEVNVWLRQQAVQRRKSNRQQTHSRTSMIMQLLRQGLATQVVPSE
jgi:glycerate kinase